MDKKNILYIVIPCYNEEAVIRETAKQVAMKMQQLYEKELISEKSKVLFVDDGSKDMTWPMIEALHAEKRTSECADGRTFNCCKICRHDRFHGCGFTG